MTQVKLYPRSSDLQALNSYLEHRAKAVIEPTDLSRRIVRTVLPSAGRPLLRRLLTRTVAPQARRRAVALGKRTPLCLNLGSAKSHLQGWVNVDLVGDGADLAWDLTKRLPFPDSSVKAIFHEHVLEHFPLPAAMALLRENHRLLAPGGILRVGVPDAGAYLRAYQNADSSFIQVNRPGRPTRLIAVQEVFFDSGHRSAYDFETLALMLAASGFHSVEQRSFGKSLLEPCPDGEHRRLETLYVEARR